SAQATASPPQEKRLPRVVISNDYDLPDRDRHDRCYCDCDDDDLDDDDDDLLLGHSGDGQRR
ncbi:unnamed protein product, partial [Adineta steineri]